jgi:hypothetical protein
MQAGFQLAVPIAFISDKKTSTVLLTVLANSKRDFLAGKTTNINKTRVCSLKAHSE